MNSLVIIRTVRLPRLQHFVLNAVVNSIPNHNPPVVLHAIYSPVGMSWESLAELPEMA